MKKSYEIEMCTGPLMGKLLLFVVPLIFSGILQLLFNSADIIIVGKFSGSHALAAVGATSEITRLFVKFFIGLSIGTDVLVAQYYGAHDETQIRETVHTSILIGLIGGLLLAAICFFTAKPLLQYMNTPPEVLDQAVLYIHIYFLGAPVMMIYNFGSAILRAAGDTRRPLYYLSVAGIINILLNLYFVIKLKMGVAGVALATTLSQTVSASLILYCLAKSSGMYRLHLSDFRIYKTALIKIICIGLPAGLQNIVFSISNLLIQTSINSFGATAVAGCAAASNLESYIYIAMNSVSQTALSFTSQNMGAGKKNRIKFIIIQCIIIVSLFGILLGASIYYFRKPLLGIFSSDGEVVQIGMTVLKVLCSTYFICGIMEIMANSVRGMGYSIMPMTVSIIGICALRILWIFTIFAQNKSLFCLFLSYPITWAITLTVHCICLAIIWKKKPKHQLH